MKTRIAIVIAAILAVCAFVGWALLQAMNWGSPSTAISDYPARLTTWQSEPGFSSWVRHFPGPSDPMLSGATMYENQAGMQGGSFFWLFVPGTPATVETERQRIAALGLSPTATADGLVQWALSDSGSASLPDSPTAQTLTSSPSTKSSINDRVAVFWSDASTGEMVYAAFVD